MTRIQRVSRNGCRNDTRVDDFGCYHRTWIMQHFNGMLQTADLWSTTSAPPGDRLVETHKGPIEFDAISTHKDMNCISLAPVAGVTVAPLAAIFHFLEISLAKQMENENKATALGMLSEFTVIRANAELLIHENRRCHVSIFGNLRPINCLESPRTRTIVDGVPKGLSIDLHPTGNQVVEGLNENENE